MFQLKAGLTFLRQQTSSDRKHMNCTRAWLRVSDVQEHLCYFQVWPNRAASFSSTEWSAKIKTVQLHPPEVNTWECDELYFHSYIFHPNATGHHICSKPLQLHTVIVLENLSAFLGIKCRSRSLLFSSRIGFDKDWSWLSVVKYKCKRYSVQKTWYPGNLKSCISQLMNCENYGPKIFHLEFILLKTKLSWNIHGILSATVTTVEPAEHQQGCNESKPRRSVGKEAATEARSHFSGRQQMLHRVWSQTSKLIQITDNVSVCDYVINLPNTALRVDAVKAVQWFLILE